MSTLWVSISKNECESCVDQFTSLPSAFWGTMAFGVSFFEMCMASKVESAIVPPQVCGYVYVNILCSQNSRIDADSELCYCSIMDLLVLRPAIKVRMRWSSCAISPKRFYMKRVMSSQSDVQWPFLGTSMGAQIATRKLLILYMLMPHVFENRDRFTVCSSFGQVFAQHISIYRRW